jgi:hypothetical protein
MDASATCSTNMNVVRTRSNNLILKCSEGADVLATVVHRAISAVQHLGQQATTDGSFEQQQI